MDGFNNNDTYETVENVSAPEKSSKVFAIISLVCGILGLLCSCCGWIGILVAVAGVVLGIISLNKEDARGMAIAGIVCGGIGLLIAVIVLILAASAGAALESMDPDSVREYFEQLENSL